MSVDAEVVVEPDRFLLQRVKVIGQEYRAVIHFHLSFAIWLDVSDLIGNRLVIAATHQLARYFAVSSTFSLWGTASFRC